VQNPFRTEPQAFRFLIATIVYFGLIVAAALAGGLWWGIGVFLVLTAAAAWWFFRAPDARRPPPVVPARPSPPGERRILVVANETVGGAALLEEVRRRSDGVHGRVRVVAPALNSPLRHLASDEDAARAAAQERLDASLARLRGGGIDASGEVGDADPLQAIEDALRTFGADELIVSTHPEGRSHWLERNVVSLARERFAVPVTHVVVDLDADRDEVR
jgi:hypothetical protein